MNEIPDAADVDGGMPVFGFARSETLIRLLEERILSQDLQPGHRLGTKKELRDQMGVAEATLNEALRVLQIRGTVVNKPGPGGGVFVNKRASLVRLGHSVLELRGNSRTVADCLKVIDYLDPLVARDAARHRSPADLAELQRLVASLIDAWDSPTQAQRANWALHRRMAAISPNSMLRAVYTALVDTVTGALGAVVRDANFRSGQSKRLYVHQELVDAVAVGDADQAEKVALRHRRITAPREGHQLVSDVSEGSGE